MARNNTQIEEDRKRYVVKSNELIQRTRYSLPINQQRMLLYLISKVRPNDTGNEEYTFSIPDFCQVAGIKLDQDGGYYYQDLKQQLKQLADSSAWIRNEDGIDSLFRWINTVDIEERSSEIRIKFHESVQPYLFDLHSRYTQYRLEEILPFKSKYSVRLYQLLKSYAFGREFDNAIEKEIQFSPSVLQEKMDAKEKTIGYDTKLNPIKKPIFKQWGQFKKNVIDRAVNEINSYSEEIHVRYELVKKGNKVSQVVFLVRYARASQILEAKKNRTEYLNGQQTQQ